MLPSTPSQPVQHSRRKPEPFSGRWRDPEAAVREGMRLFNRGEYFETHEVLEEAWRSAEGDVKRFLKGLIHAAVALLHFERHNPVGARNKHESMHFYLDPLAPSFAGIDVEGLLCQVDAFMEPLLQNQDQQWREDSWPRPTLQWDDRGDGQGGRTVPRVGAANRDDAGQGLVGK